MAWIRVDGFVVVVVVVVVEGDGGWSMEWKGVGEGVVGGRWWRDRI